MATNRIKTFFALLIFLPSVCIAGQYQVVTVVDGDTIDVDYNGKIERIRLLCVNTPESVHPIKNKNTEAGKKASEYTRSRLSGQSVDLVFEDKIRGKYGRLLAYVFINGENFNVELVREGWSPYYTKYGKSKKYHEDFLKAQLTQLK